MTPAPQLEERFLEPPGWRWFHFKNKQGASLRGAALMPFGAAKAIVVLLQGRGEFIEKYFETARELAARDFAVWTLDWQGHGGSDAGAPRFGQHAEDLHEFIQTQIKPGSAPLVMLAHSMGANIGLRYMKRCPGVFSCAALSAPMLGVKALQNWPIVFSFLLTGFFGLLCPRLYAFGQKDWSASDRDDTPDIFSHDPRRRAVHNAWCFANPRFQTGGATFSWLASAIRSCFYLRLPGVLISIQTPCLLAIAGREGIVDNTASAAASRALPRCTRLDLPTAGHEILMETDESRSRFFEAFHHLIKNGIIE